MSVRHLATTLVVLCPALIAQVAKAGSLPEKATIPITFTATISAGHTHAGDAVLARTTQRVRMADGSVLPAGAPVRGHIVRSAAFAYDSTPYAKQPRAELTVQIDSIAGLSAQRIAVRALASPLAVEAASEPRSTDLDSLSTTTQVGGDLLVPSQSEIRNREGDVVAYRRRDGVYARLIPSGTCDGSETEVSVGVFSASACGLYGFGSVDLTAEDHSSFTLSSTHESPRIWKHSAALLEVMPETGR